MANKAYQFRLYPTQEQGQLFAKTFGCVRFVYNKMLAERKEVYEQFKDDKEALKMQKLPTPAKYKSEYTWLKEVDSLALSAYSTVIVVLQQTGIGTPRSISSVKDCDC